MPWSFEHSGQLSLNPGNDTFSQSCLRIVRQRLGTGGLGPESMGAMATIMHTFADMKLHIEPAVAELLVSKAFESMKSIGDLSNTCALICACAKLGYAPPVALG